jgi:penicillin-binding protein 2A
MAGKTGTTETSFDASVANDQWVIGYTPDVVIATWLGFEKPDRKKQHYLEGSSTEEASAIFQTEANYIMPYVSGKKFTELYPGVENAYAINGQTTGNQDDTGKTDASVDDLRKKAEDAFDAAKDAAKNFSGTMDKVKKGWDKVKNLFGAQ